MNREAEGYDVPAVEAWIAANVAGLTPPFDWTKLQGGHSNLTFRLQDAGGNVAVVRRPPTAGRCETRRRRKRPGQGGAFARMAGVALARQGFCAGAL